MSKTIELDHRTKIEGHAALRIVLKKGKVIDCELSSVEGSRYFEDILVGRDYTEAFELSSRICGICSCAHTIAAITAVEKALGLEPSEQTILLRKLLTLGERIRSHSTHLYFLALPDYFGYESAMAMLPKFKPEITRALQLMKTGNMIVKKIGGRDLHPVSACVGGFLHVPTADDVESCIKQLKSVKQAAVETVELYAGIKVPTFDAERQMVSLSEDGEYAMLRGCVQSKDHCFLQREYDQYFKEFHENYSTAKFVVQAGKEYRVGSLSRLHNSRQYLSRTAKRLLKETELSFPCYNPFYNNLAQAIELVHSIDHAIQLLQAAEFVPEEPIKPKLKAGRGIAAIEVPRGILWHEYVLDKKGKITKANIITPTTQNLRAMQEDIRSYLPIIMKRIKKKEKIALEIEKLLRSYDPCFSCSTHFLKVDWEEE